MKRALLLAAALLAPSACKVDELDLEGKACPCVAGFTCETSTNTCVRDPVDAAMVDVPPNDGVIIDAPIDAPGIDAIDAPPGASCLGSAGGTSLFSDDFADLIGWVTVGGAWSATGGEAVQTDTGGSLIYAYPAGTNAFTDYRVASRARRTGGVATGSVELALRKQASGDGMYQCAWSPANGALKINWTRTNGSLGGTIASTTVNVGAIPGYDPLAPVVIETQAMGTQLTCCVRDLAGATVTMSDTRYTAGSPGIKTSSQSAAFDDFVVQMP
jgi:hypothetical protein